jgi:hypothetical protein
LIAERDASRRTFEYVFGKLRIETEDAKNFVTEMAALAEKKNKVTVAGRTGREPDKLRLTHPFAQYAKRVGQPS